MNKIGIKELRQNASKYLDQVKHGEVTEAIERGKLIAVIASPSSEANAFEGLVASGQIIPADGKFQIPSYLCKGSQANSADVLSDLRSDPI